LCIKYKCKSYRNSQEGAGVLSKEIEFIINIMTMAKDKVRVRVSF